MQDRFRSGFNPAEVDADTAVAIANFDAGILDLSFAADPEIELTDTGWKLNKNGKIASVSVMIDAVLPSPDLSKVADVLVRDLISQQLLRPVSEGFGTKTVADGRLVDGQSAPSAGFFFLGCFALGSVVAADLLGNCIGEDASRWVTGVLDRLGFLDGVAA